MKASDCGRHAGEAIEPQLMVSRHSSTAMVSGMQVKLPIRHARRQSSTVPAGRTSSTQGFSQIRLQSSVPSDPPAPDALPPEPAVPPAPPLPVADSPQPVAMTANANKTAAVVLMAFTYHAAKPTPSATFARADAYGCTSNASKLRNVRSPRSGSPET